MAQNPNDGTSLGTGEVISDEYNDPVAGGRRDPNLPPTGYKLPRSKIVVGNYGQDGGDASPDTPLATESRAERMLAEQASMRDRDHSAMPAATASGERSLLTDCRGHHLMNRGVR